MWILMMLLQTGWAAAPTPAPPERGPSWGLGVRTGIWMAEAAAPQLGGHVLVLPERGPHLGLFSDHSLRTTGNLAQVDHVIGFSVRPALARWQRGDLRAAVGSCVDFRTWRHRSDLALQATDVLFAPRVGAVISHAPEPAWRLEAGLLGLLYVGNTVGTYGWGAPSRTLTASPVLQGHVAVTRVFGVR